MNGQPNMNQACASFVLIDHTNNGSVAGVSLQSRAQDIIDALTEFFNGAFARCHGGTFSFRWADSVNDRLPNERACHVRHTLNVPDALACHTVVNGQEDIEISLDGCDSLTQGSDSLTCGLSHEIAEDALDPGANQWAENQDGSGKMRSHEAADRVQNTTVRTSNGCEMTNFLLRSAFIPGAPPPWDYVSLSTGESLMADQLDYSNGYDVEADAPNAENQLLPQKRSVRVLGWENLSELAKKRKFGKISRARKRGVKEVLS